VYSSSRSEVVDRKNRPPKPQRQSVINRGFDDVLWGLIMDCWAHDPPRRPTAATVCSRLFALNDRNVEHLTAKPKLISPRSPLNQAQEPEIPTCGSQSTLFSARNNTVRSIPLPTSTSPVLTLVPCDIFVYLCYLKYPSPHFGVPNQPNQSLRRHRAPSWAAQSPMILL
jgi:hypothetical protein